MKKKLADILYWIGDKLEKAGDFVFDIGMWMQKIGRKMK